MAHRNHRDVAEAAVTAVSGHAEKLLPHIAHPVRLQLLYAIHAAPGSTVAELAAATRLTPNTTTKTLHRLRDAELVDYQRNGRHHHWSLADPELHEILHQLGAPHSDLHPPH
ncbi:ArsR/SmtB family transcription factor [Propionibacteriaceae bacterium Y2011]|uniref:ArsR/SmtB family transcription factor n=1 Tax=Microlunatus sp. Y2014 TaxID=3418488 RepID=UPI003B460499